MLAGNTGNAVAAKRSATTAVLLGGAVVMLALPSAVLAFSSRFDPAPLPAAVQAVTGTFQPSSVDPRLARSISVRALGQNGVFRFTPANSANRPDSAVTVAVRVDPNAARLANLRRSAVGDNPPVGAAALGIAPNGYSLGAARGYQSFAKNLGIGSDSRRTEVPDLASFKPGTGAKGDPSRFAPRIALDEKEKAGRSPRTFGGDGEQSVDLGGSYRLTRNLNVTAGVRYQEERDRLVPLTTDRRQDSQAVYVGTQFRF